LRQKRISIVRLFRRLLTRAGCPCHFLPCHREWNRPVERRQLVEVLVLLVVFVVQASRLHVQRSRRDAPTTCSTTKHLRPQARRPRPPGRDFFKQLLNPRHAHVDGVLFFDREPRRRTQHPVGG